MVSGPSDAVDPVTYTDHFPYNLNDRDPKSEFSDRGGDSDASDRDLYAVHKGL